MVLMIWQKLDKKLTYKKLTWQKICEGKKNNNNQYYLDTNCHYSCILKYKNVCYQAIIFHQVSEIRNKGLKYAKQVIHILILSLHYRQ